ncbi:MAG: tRNA (N6-isopentenyl adenosine(37)-C2)-methylthiotransferase MiaB [Candidatus Omnitrophota bacterium]
MQKYLQHPMKQEVTTKKVFIRTLGCQMNDRDSEALCGLLREHGFSLVDSPQKADIVLFNTCSVRQHAEDKVFSELGQLRKLKIPNSKFQIPNKSQISNSKSPIIGVIGCMAQNYKEEIFKRAPQVDLVVGPNDLTSIPTLLKAMQTERCQALAVGAMERERDFFVSDFRLEKNRASVVISEGCNNFCTYCVVPFVRGRLRSRSSEAILTEIKRTLSQGIRHITLLGQNVNAYRDNDQKLDFVGLLKIISQMEGLESVDFITSHPKDTRVELFKVMAGSDKIKQFLHLPVQSGSNRILKLMNRGYTRQHYLKLAQAFRKIAGGRLTTDIIVGFPGETKKDFQDTLDLMERVRFDAAYIFKYSPRPHTQAADFADNVPMQEKKRRHQLALNLQKKISREIKCAG